MSRVEKKCLLASGVTHGFLVLLLVFGSAFFTPKPKTLELPRLRVVPQNLVDDALAGGGGNPNIPITDDTQKGDTLTPQPAPAAAVPAAQPQPQPQPVQPPQPEPVPPKSVVKKPEPKVEPKKVEPKKADASPKKPEKAPEPVKPDPNAVSKTPSLKELLKPIVRTGDDKAKAKAEAEAREAAREAARAESAYQAKLAKAIGGAASGLREGFASGTKVDVAGPGGVAYADYRVFVQAIYQETWERLLPQDILADDTTSLVSVTISRSGKVVNSRVLRRSSETAIDRIVQKTLNGVSYVRPFPSGAKDEERTFTIEFNFRKRRITG